MKQMFVRPCCEKQKANGHRCDDFDLRHERVGVRRGRPLITEAPRESEQLVRLRQGYRDSQVQANYAVVDAAGLNVCRDYWLPRACIERCLGIADQGGSRRPDGSGRSVRALVGMQPSLQPWHAGVSSGWRTHLSDMGGCIDRFQTSHRVSLRSRTAQNLS